MPATRPLDQGDARVDRVEQQVPAFAHPFPDARQMFRVDFVHPEQQFTQARPHDFIAVRPCFWQQAHLIFRARTDVIPKPHHHVAPNHWHRVIQGLHHRLHPVVLVQESEVVHGGACRGEYAFVFILHHVVEQRYGVGGHTSEQARQHVR